ncbi:hypothetical protein H5410_019337 [Solanum commersonii]|uniref:Uncharacterized protein n=1 Tax=Solanum commersonii TaxID=4109 RepID=A0A9J5Z801_SOLCO|nr:hypothetical protein H5410_019337 [Solanum commersonii]
MTSNKQFKPKKDDIHISLFNFVDIRKEKKASLHCNVFTFYKKGNQPEKPAAIASVTVSVRVRGSPSTPSTATPRISLVGIAVEDEAAAQRSMFLALFRLHGGVAIPCQLPSYRGEQVAPTKGTIVQSLEFGHLKRRCADVPVRGLERLIMVGFALIPLRAYDLLETVYLPPRDSGKMISDTQNLGNLTSGGEQEISNPWGSIENSKTLGDQPKLSKRVSDKFERGMEKTKVAASAGMKKVKEGTTVSVNWMKVKYNKHKLTNAKK